MDDATRIAELEASLEEARRTNADLFDTLKRRNDDLAALRTSLEEARRAEKAAKLLHEQHHVTMLKMERSLEEARQERDVFKELADTYGFQLNDAEARIQTLEAALQEHWDHDDTWCFGCHMELERCDARAALQPTTDRICLLKDCSLPLNHEGDHVIRLLGQPTTDHEANRPPS